MQGATTLAGRLVNKFGEALAVRNGLKHIFPQPEILAEANVASIGLPQARAQTIRLFARFVLDHNVSFEGVLNREALLQKLCGIPGFGRWTAQYVAMRALGDPDAFPSGDLGLLRGFGLRNARELEQRAEVWRPWRAYAAVYIWTRSAGKSLLSRPRQAS